MYCIVAIVITRYVNTPYEIRIVLLLVLLLLLIYYYYYYYYYYGVQNLLENTKDKELMKTNLTLMVQWQIGRQVNMLQSRSNEDPEFVADLEYLVSVLTAKLEDIR